MFVAATGCGKGSSTGAVLASTRRESAATRSGTSSIAIANDEPDDGSWIRPAKDLASSRYSKLTQITPENVRALRVAFTFATGSRRGHEAAPLVVNGTMYVLTPYPNVLYALDLTKPGAPLKWTFTPQPLASAQGLACCDVVNRGASYADGKVIFNTLDGQTIAVDATTGAEVWRTQVGDVSRGESLTMAPFIAKKRVLVGASGSEFGIRGWLTALDLDRGKVAWRAYHTGPDSEALIGPRFKPYYAADRGRDLGVRTWPGDSWRIGGGSAWGWVSYDPSLDLVYYGTANPAPWNAEQRAGDNKWTAGIFARDLESGQAVWFVSTSPHDLFEYDSVNELILLDLTIGSETRHVAVRPDRNGFMYVIDRQTGEILSADPFGPMTAFTGFDLKAGRPIENTAKHPTAGKIVHGVCPAAAGMKNWQPAAFSPRTGLLYVPHQLLCMDVEPLDATYIAETPYIGMNVKMYAAATGDESVAPHRGELLAWDVVKRRPAWSIAEDLPVWSGALVTAGDVAFYGTLDGWFKAVNARTGAPLWQFKCGSGIVGQPITYVGPDGKQYVAVLSGVGGWVGAIAAANLDVRDSSIAFGLGNAVRDLPNKTGRGGALYVFALP